MCDNEQIVQCRLTLLDKIEIVGLTNILLFIVKKENKLQYSILYMLKTGMQYKLISCRNYIWRMIIHLRVRYLVISRVRKENNVVLLPQIN